MPLVRGGQDPWGLAVLFITPALELVGKRGISRSCLLERPETFMGGDRNGGQQAVRGPKRKIKKARR
eukprot:290134-Pyramimonas_sp.AAC.1